MDGMGTARPVDIAVHRPAQLAGGDMLLSEIRTEVIDRSGQFILDDADIEIDSVRFRRLINNVLRTYNKYAPAHGHCHVKVNAFFYQFDTADPCGIPDWIPDVMPVRGTGGSGLGIFAMSMAFGNPLYSRNQYSYGDPFHRHEFTYEYRKPTLYLPYSGDYDVHWVKNHVVTDTGGEGEDEPEISTIDTTDTHPYFFDLITGRFLESIGRYRRAFTPTDIPLEMDASEVVREGQEKFQKAEEALKQNGIEFYLAWGG